MALQANGTNDYVWIATDGNVGINTITPGAKLSIVGDLSATGGLSAAAVTGASYFGGTVGIGITAPTKALHLADSCVLGIGTGQ